MGFPLESRKALSADDRRAELVRLRQTGQAIAQACNEHFSLVSHVIGGRRLTSPGARKIMAYIAGRLGLPIEEVFPETKRERPERRRATA